MSAKALLLDLSRAGLTVAAKGGRLHVSPRERITAALRESIRSHRDELLAMLSDEEIGISRDAARDLDEPMTCASCREVAAVMLLMAPGPDGVPWALCRRCYQ